jgi:hypothetical protein
MTNLGFGLTQDSDENVYFFGVRANDRRPSPSGLSFYMKEAEIAFLGLKVLKKVGASEVPFLKESFTLRVPGKVWTLWVKGSKSKHTGASTHSWMDIDGDISGTDFTESSVEKVPSPIPDFWIEDRYGHYGRMPKEGLMSVMEEYLANGTIG